MSMPAVEFRNIRKHFGDRTILNDLSFSVANGERLALIGPSGSGKTTVLRILMTLEGIDGGEVVVGGQSVFSELRNGTPQKASARHLSRMRSQFGMVFQHFNLFPHKTVLENVTLAPILNKQCSPGAARQAGLELLKMVGLENKANERPAALSGGQKQRVGIARALALKPQILLLDEITSALDPELVEEVLAVITRLGRETDMTMLLVTHEMSFAHEFADRVLFLDAGAIVEEGTPDKIFRDPSCERTRAFLKKILAAGQRL
ncbi:MAG: ectoine/hydroxyectoine ABC transporter ATP-binding protein EhuA [Mesorhizobium sp.]|uniref:ectoine/hydroxyectoine ABC transporter ATP-binding protein EhuA n=1 Tax=Mesorhizobium sp. TaxID=1871066 RepID=UPI000FEA0831|nr:ectoine/hydroxyectoine ABC transporter ATP-binding protein EhuA [Mesorhizobium sp.]RWE20566.1 MAG: ectoine/hydroxyectoine ABC transporter ATP-binding protein EhuA [Mesorhizobium sp.]